MKNIILADKIKKTYIEFEAKFGKESEAIKSILTRLFRLEEYVRLNDKNQAVARLNILIDSVLYMSQLKDYYPEGSNDQKAFDHFNQFKKFLTFEITTL